MRLKKLTSRRSYNSYARIRISMSKDKKKVIQVVLKVPTELAHDMKDKYWELFIDEDASKTLIIRPAENGGGMKALGMSACITCIGLLEYFEPNDVFETASVKRDKEKYSNILEVVLSKK